MYFIKKIRKNWQIIGFLLCAVAASLFPFFLLTPPIFAVIYLTATGGILLSLVFVSVIFKLHKKLCLQTKKKKNLEEILCKWKGAEKSVESLKETALEERNKLQELIKKSPKEIPVLVANSAEDFDDTSSAKVINDKTDSNSFCPSSSRSRSLSVNNTFFPSSDRHLQRATAIEIKEIKKNINEDLAVLGEALTQLDKDQTAEIAMLQSDIANLKTSFTSHGSY